MNVNIDEEKIDGFGNRRRRDVFEIYCCVDDVE